MPALLPAIQRYLPDVIVVDDGSTDNSAALAQEHGATLLRNEQPAGKGGALATGWRHAWQEGYAWSLCMDGDGQHSPDDIPVFLQAATQGNVDLVIGNRMGQATGMPFIRRQINRWMSAHLSALAGARFPDTQCGFRLMRMAAWRNLELRSRHFEIESETLLAFHRHRLGISFVPIRVIYGGERSKIRPLSDTWRWLRWRRRAQTSRF